MYRNTAIDYKKPFRGVIGDIRTEYGFEDHEYYGADIIQDDREFLLGLQMFNDIKDNDFGTLADTVDKYRRMLTYSLNLALRIV
jgi:hypothetical protein